MSQTAISRGKEIIKQQIRLAQSGEISPNRSSRPSQFNCI